MILVQLGRAGDIINVLPLAFCLSRKIGRLQWLVGHEYASILEGVSYVTPIIWNGAPETLQQALRRYQGATPLCVQAHLNPDNRKLTDSFAREQWRYAGLLSEKESWPLIFDSQNLDRAHALRDKVLAKRDVNKPLVLCATDSVSTPYSHANKLIATIRGLDCDVIDLSEVRAERIYDLLPLYDAADCLVSVDTVHLHLSKASQCPVVALINDGWRGCVPPPQAVASWRYAELGNDLSPVFNAVKKQLARKADSIAVVVHTYKPGHNERHRRAMATHPEDTIYFSRDYRPKMKEYFEAGLATGKEVIVFFNDDVALPVGALDRIKRHARQWDFGCSRRPAEPTGTHIGREVFWLRSEWLKANWGRIPNPHWSVQRPDLILARWMRKERGIQTTMENLLLDMAPVELPNVITHEYHKSAWDTAEVLNSPEGIENERIWNQG